MSKEQWKRDKTRIVETTKYLTGKDEVTGEDLRVYFGDIIRPLCGEDLHNRVIADVMEDFFIEDGSRLMGDTPEKMINRAYDLLKEHGVSA